MPPTPEDEMKMAGRGRKPEPESAPTSSPKKLLLIFTMIVLGLPVFVVLLVPPAGGAWILWQQYAAYQKDSRWRPFSVFGWATHTVDPDLAASLGRPALASCNEFRESEGSDAAVRIPTSEQIRRSCPELGAWQAWLLSPDAWVRLRQSVARALQVIPVSSLLFLLGAIAAWLLRLFGLEWRARGLGSP